MNDTSNSDKELVFPHPTVSGALATMVPFGAALPIFNVGTNEARACILARAIRIRARSSDPREEVEKWLEKELARPTRTETVGFANVTQIFDAHKEGEAKLGVDPLTAARNRVGFLRVVETVVFSEQGGVRTKKHSHNGESLGPQDYPLAATVCSTRFNGPFVNTFVRAKLDERTALDKDYKAVCATIRGDMGRAKSMFCEMAMSVVYPNSGIVLPDMRSFIQADTFPRPDSVFVLRSRHCVSDAHDDVNALKSLDPDKYVIAALALESGSGPVETITAHTDDLGPVATPTLKVRVGTKWERTLLLSAEVHRELRARPRGYILRGDERARRDQCTETAQWLRDHGSGGVTSPLDEFCDLFAYFLASRMTPVLLHTRLGNQARETTEKYLSVEEPMSDKDAALWPKGLAQPLP